MSGKSALVTGASTGIGEAITTHLASRGWRVFAGVRKEADGERLRNRGDGRIVPVSLDVTDEAEVAAACKVVADAVGSRGLDGLVNNAGVARGGPIEVLPLDEWRQQFEVNVVGQIAVTKAALGMLRDARGRIVFIGSISGRVASPMVGPYSASKHAIEAIGEALREEIRPWGIGVSVVEPGVIKTPIWSKGMQTADELEAALPEEAKQLYREAIDEIRASIQKNDSRGIGPEKVAAVVESALTSSRPRARYLVGPDAVVAGNLARVLPDRLRVAVFRKLLAL